jgi:L-alanine-DL-glutamate epimerase-like enolase superfamily enzyme
MPEPSISWQAVTLNLRSPFGLSYGVSETREAFLLTLGDDEGWGEGTIPRYYGIPSEELTAHWEAVRSSGRPFPEHLSDIETWIGSTGPAPARCALSLALHDRIGKRCALPLWRLLNLPVPSPLKTSFTIGLDTADEMARRAREASRFKILKIKLGSDDDVPRFRAVREARPDAILYVDANSGWTRDQAVANVKKMEREGLSLVEQPVAKHDIAGMGFVQANVGIPVVADESLQSAADVEALASVGVQAINVKLMKLGGLGPALDAIHRARDLGLRIMLGCMVETSLGVTAMAHLAGMADWLDLDAPILISNDPFEGVEFDDAGEISVPDRPGIGATPRPAS